ncbi:TPA: replicative DNA helicase [Streptococcus agalactiae]|jgi:replicative DNA helicase (phage and plasmid) (EC 3.6.1.-)|uniref:Replicative DNA helicase n=1 Tax=Streptococcus agalactiae serotype V (strain ATCC BAA-611 / 2603 V/R) TaxID=208435 RepID=Q8DXH8_STRA5|nr:MULTISPECIES: replicative DNA helicase [Streptococcus]AYJ75013.1 replicative DNA helicase [Streptococcus phage LF3]QBX17092.1 replicative DNA helicase [Streptococcus phage Javan33]QBX31081.1 replicative DNA helicase [Streptococcus phage Javan6]HEP3198456.1 replicative DNA helicase [Streptococcus pyogenes]AAN00735.1 prophage LambdaSa2, replicative DNA helicase [Streptococcus agalactiae 2603V/R]
MDELKVLPHDIQAEQSVLGSIFIKPEKMIEVAEYLKPNDFYRPAHKILFKAMVSLADRGEAIDIVTIKSTLESTDELGMVGGISYIAEIVNAVPTSSHAEHYAKIVAKKAQLRSIIDNLSDSIGNAYDEDMDIDEIIAKAERSLIEVSQASNKSSFRPIHDVLLENHSKIEERSNNTSQITGIETGFYDFDKLITGLHEDQLIVLAARPAMGKTALALNIAQNVATKSNKAVAVFSLEMGAESLVERMLSAEGTIINHHIRTGNLTVNEWQRLIYAQGQLAEAPIFIDDTAGVKITDIRARARRLSQETDGLGLIVIDYLQLIQGSRSDNRQQEVSEISRQLKIIAKELKVPVIALSQLSRGVEQRNDKRPIMSDLRESGSIEQDADIVAFLYRDAYYQDKKEGQPENDITELIIRKNRHGNLGTVKLYFHKEYTKFSSVEEE